MLIKISRNWNSLSNLLAGSACKQTFRGTIHSPTSPTRTLSGAYA